MRHLTTIEGSRRGLRVRKGSATARVIYGADITGNRRSVYRIPSRSGYGSDVSTGHNLAVD